MGLEGGQAENLVEDTGFIKSLLNNISEGLLTIDTESRILYVNPGIEQILGYRPEDMVGSPMMKIIPERLRPAHTAGLKQYLETGEKHIDWTGVELPALHKDGHEVPVSVSLREHTYDGQQLFTGIFTDVSERKQRERRLIEQKQQLEEFADLLAHDLRNPLAVAKGNLELLQDTHDTPEIEEIERAHTRMEQIIDDTLQHARTGTVSGTTEVIPFDEKIRIVWESIPTTKEADLTLPDPSWKIRAHEGRLSQLLENLITNAVEHAGPTVTVEVGVLGEEDGFYVEDDGPGLPQAIRVLMETPSGLTRERDEGYGLQIVEQVAEDHGWETRLREGSGGGARFEFHGATVFQD